MVFDNIFSARDVRERKESAAFITEWSIIMRCFQSDEPVKNMLKLFY